MDRAAQTWELTQQLLADDPERHLALLAMAHLSAAAILFEQCDPEMAKAILAALEGVIRNRRAENEKLCATIARLRSIAG